MVNEFGTNQKLIGLYDFLLVINTNLPHILHRLRDIAFDKTKIAIFCYQSCLYNPSDGGVPYIISSLLRSMCPGSTEFGEITENNGHYAVQGHSRSPILVPIESSCATSY